MTIFLLVFKAGLHLNVLISITSFKSSMDWKGGGDWSKTDD